MTALAPVPPMLLVREGIAFWVETCPVESWTATLQALHEGCFRESDCFDTNGKLWPIVDVQFARRPSFAERVLPWRTVPIKVTFGTPMPVPLYKVVERIVKTLEFEGHEYGDHTQEEIRQRARGAATPEQLIQEMAAFGEVT